MRDQNMKGLIKDLKQKPQQRCDEMLDEFLFPKELHMDTRENVYITMSIVNWMNFKKNYFDLCFASKKT